MKLTNSLFLLILVFGVGTCCFSCISKNRSKNLIPQWDPRFEMAIQAIQNPKDATNTEFFVMVSETLAQNLSLSPLRGKIEWQIREHLDGHSFSSSIRLERVWNSCAAPDKLEIRSVWIVERTDGEVILCTNIGPEQLDQKTLEEPYCFFLNRKKSKDFFSFVAELVRDNTLISWRATQPSSSGSFLSVFLNGKANQFIFIGAKDIEDAEIDLEGSKETIPFLQLAKKIERLVFCP